MIQKNSLNNNDRAIQDLVKLNADCLKRAFWLSGTPCGGKTTISKIISEQQRWDIYHVDEHWDNHCTRANSRTMPTFHKITRLTGDALWLRPLNEQIACEPLFVEESFLLLLEDVINILKKSSKNLIIDASIVPKSALQVVPDRNHIFYLIPEERFQRDRYSKREWIREVLSKTSDPIMAFENWMTRDASYARWLEKEVDCNKLAMMSVNENRTIEDTVEFVTKHYLKID
jgi:hypothetical protein